MFKYFFVCLSFLLLSCGPDYGIIGHDEIIVEVEVEVPGDPVGKQWVDSFIQVGSTEGVDILWVIDTSGSMIRFEQSLLDGIAEMMNALPPTGWRLAMVSNDPYKAAIEQQFPLVPGDDIIDAEDMYYALARGHWEQGFAAAHEYISTNPYSSTWMRNDAALLVVFVSDEEEQSDNSNNQFRQVSDFVHWYSSLRSQPVYLASIVTHEATESACSWTTNAVDVGERYMEATNYFNGVIVDICSEDWTPGVNDASNQLEPYELYELTYEPIEGSIRVFVDQMPVADTYWTYDASNNVVYFNTIPDTGEWVEIVYRHEDEEHVGPPPN